MYESPLRGNDPIFLFANHYGANLMKLPVLYVPLSLQRNDGPVLCNQVIKSSRRFEPLKTTCLYRSLEHACSISNGFTQTSCIKDSVHYNSMIDTRILSAYEVMCRGHFRLLEYIKQLKQHALGPFRGNDIHVTHKLLTVSQ